MSKNLSGITQLGFVKGKVRIESEFNDNAGLSWQSGRFRYGFAYSTQKLIPEKDREKKLLLERIPLPRCMKNYQMT